jgi:inosine-uridine nucleoside N-ribohydrolase
VTRKIIIDTDPGIDDAMAIFLALRSPELELIGLTTVFGNVHTALATTNALRLLEIANRTDIRVAHGADQPLERAYAGPVPLIHGEDGQGNTDLPAPSTKPLEISAAEFIVQQIMAAPGQVTLVPIGPLTNIALALQLEPRIAQFVREVVLMGGNAFCAGNATPASEANIHNDPEAADLVFGANWPVTMVGLDVTHHIVMTTAQMNRLETAQNPLARHLAKINPLYLEFVASSAEIDGNYIHDPSAVVYLTHPQAFTTAQHPVRVETLGISAGKTWANPFPKRTLPDWAGRPIVNICVGVDSGMVLDVILERLGD